MTQTIKPVIKWSGSKRKVAPVLSSLVPSHDRYFEPFVGSGAMLPFRKSREGVAGDVIPELIDLWRVIRDEPDVTAAEYMHRWKRLQAEGHTAYYDIRDSFNTSRSPHDFLFLSRTCVNGLIRFNNNRDFNNSLHHTRPGISPDSLRTIILSWSSATEGVHFSCADYRETLSHVSAGDFVFLDPPYAGTKGRYMPDAFDFNAFYDELERLNRIGARWMLTLDGYAGSRTYDSGIPPDVYTSCFPIPTGNSPFTKLMNTSLEQVLESVYLNFEPAAGSLDKVTDFRNHKLGIISAQDVQQGTLF